MSAKYKNAKLLAHEAISRMNKRITDEIFLIIQNDSELMKSYLDILAHSHGVNPVMTLNMAIGKEVKKKYGLENVDRESNPSCTLIDSHQKFE